MLDLASCFVSHAIFSPSLFVMGKSIWDNVKLLVVITLCVITLCRMTEPPFRPREKLIEKQKYFQNIHKHTYLKGPYDKITSVAIPLALAATSLYLIVSNLFVNHFPENFIYIICIDSVRLNIWMSLLIYGAIHFKHWFTSLICSGKRDLQYVTWNREERISLVP